MSECVVRMEMPLNCFECPMYDYNRQKLCRNAHLDLRPIPNGGVPKPDWCPILCQLPEGHGRLVDADALKAWFFRPYSNEESYCNMDAAKAIDKAPNIVPAERSET